MPIDPSQRHLQAAHFRAKLASEKQKMDVVHKVKDGAGDFVLLDTRDRGAYDKAHIPGAQSMPIDSIQTLAAGLDPQREYVVYCWNHT
jgi:rhodanese-related sulfurtransferase